jgi:hypothetical protein
MSLSGFGSTYTELLVSGEQEGKPQLDETEKKSAIQKGMTTYLVKSGDEKLFSNHMINKKK